MMLARVEGNVVATRKHPSLDGWRLVICQPINAAANRKARRRSPLTATARACISGSSFHRTAWPRAKPVGDEKSPVRWLVIGIVDEKEPGTPV